MKLKIYSQKTCHYCKTIKDALIDANIEIEEIEVESAQEEWNHVTRITGMGITPTIFFEGDYWLPTRDFRTKEELIKKIEFYNENPIDVLNEEEQTQQLLNSIRNLSFGINGINQTLSILLKKVEGNTTVPPMPRPTGANPPRPFPNAPIPPPPFPPSIAPKLDINTDKSILKDIKLK